MRDVLIVGGGPAGTATAILAARAGLDVLLIDRAAFPREKPCAECLNPEAVRDLADLGVMPEIEAAAPARLAGMRIVADDGTAVTGYHDRAAGDRDAAIFGLAVPRTVLDTALVRAAARAGVEIREQAALERLVVERGVVRGAIVRRHGEHREERCRVLVGADGLNSRVANTLGLARRGGPRRLALAAHLAGVRRLGTCGEMFCGRGWYVGVAALGPGVASVAMVVPLADRRAIAADREGFFRARLASVHGLAERAADTAIVREILVTGPFARRTVTPIVDGALLVGDAAEFFDPFTGEGVFAALRGGRLAAAALVAALASGGEASRARLAPYADAREGAFRGKRLLERVAGFAATRPPLMRRFTHSLGTRPEIADLWIGAAGGHVPVRTLFSPRHLGAFLHR